MAQKLLALAQIPQNTIMMQKFHPNVEGQIRFSDASGTNFVRELPTYFDFQPRYGVDYVQHVGIMQLRVERYQSVCLLKTHPTEQRTQLEFVYNRNVLYTLSAFRSHRAWFTFGRRGRLFLRYHHIISVHQLIIIILLRRVNHWDRYPGNKKFQTNTLHHTSKKKYSPPSSSNFFPSASNNSSCMKCSEHMNLALQRNLSGLPPTKSIHLVRRSGSCGNGKQATPLSAFELGHIGMQHNFTIARCDGNCYEKRNSTNHQCGCGFCSLFSLKYQRRIQTTPWSTKSAIRSNETYAEPDAFAHHKFYVNSKTSTPASTLSRDAR